MYKPRNDFVVIKRVVNELSPGGVALPQASAEGQRFYVEAIGPLVEGLLIGDRVIIAAEPGEGSYFPIPNAKDLILIREKWLAAVVIGEK